MDYDEKLACTRRQFFGRTSTGIGIAALAGLFRQDGLAAGGLQGLPHFAPKARRVIFLHQSGGPSHLDLFWVGPDHSIESTWWDAGVANGSWDPNRVFAATARSAT